MGQIREVRPALRLLGAFSRHETALAWTRQVAEQRWGTMALASEPFEFDDTAYYEPTMGADLKKIFFAFEELMDPAELVEVKHISNQLETRFATEHATGESRPLNLDPGYITEAKLVLATTKDRDHRIYLDRGIYAEVTLHYHAGAWRTRPWTYPDYQQVAYHHFFTRCREYLRSRLRGQPTVAN